MLVLIVVPALVAVQFPTTRAFDSLWWEVYEEVYKKLGRAVKGEGSVPQQMRAECQRDFMPVSR